MTAAALAALSEGVRIGKDRMLIELAEAAQRTGLIHLSVLFLDRFLTTQSYPLPTWTGRREEAPLFVDLMETEEQGVSHAMLATKFIARAAEASQDCTFFVEPRLVGILQRSFPNTKVVPKGGKDRFLPNRGYFANLYVLRTLFDRTYAAMQSNPARMVFDTGKAAVFRQSYQAGRKPLIGLSWSSPHLGKELPSLEVWAQLLHRIHGTFVSLQYAAIPNDIKELERLSGKSVIVDPAVNQKVDLDTFASQVGAMDIVISISNSTAHFSGALGIPLIVVRDNGFRWVWDVNGPGTAWYNSANVIRKGKRGWNETFEAIATKVEELAR